MHRRDFLRKLVSPRAPEGVLHPLDVRSIPYLSRALGKEPEEIRYVDASDGTIHNYTYHLQRKRGARNVGTLILSIQLGDESGGGEVIVSDMKVRTPPRRESLAAATCFSVSDERVTFYEGEASLSVSYGYELSVRH